MAGDIDRDIRRFRRRIQAGCFLGGTCEALAALALVLAAGLLVLRLFGGAVPVHPAWLLLLIPAVLWGLRAARRRGFGPRLSAAHLDRRLGLGGLLMTALERDPQAHLPRLRLGLDRARAALPRVRLGPMAMRLGVGLAVLALVFLLPVPKEEPAAANPLAAEALADFAARLESLEEQKGLREETHEDLTQRLDDLQQRLEQKGEVAWTDLDALEQKMEHEQALQAARLAKARLDLGAFARGEDERARGEAASESGRLAELLQDARAAGLLDKLPEDLAQKLLGADGEGASGSELEAGFTSEALRQLAAALAESADDALDGLGGLESLDGVELADLDKLLDELDGEPCELCSGDEPNDDCPG